MADKLTVNNALELLEKYLNNKEEKISKSNNLFEILNIREKSHSSLLKWLLDIRNENNDLQKEFLKKFLKELECSEDTINKLINAKDFEIIPEKKIEDIDNKGYIDIFIVSENAKFVCVIENKLDAKICKNQEGKDQLERYKKYVEKNYENFEKKIFVLNTVYSEKYDKTDNGYIITEYSNIVQIIRNIIMDPKINVDTIIETMLLQYINYWEYNKKFGGYTKLLDNNYYLWDVCKFLKNSPEFDKIKNEIKELVIKTLG